MAGFIAARIMRICITQSNYIPWKGYFDLIASVDRCILYDTVQYTKRDWRNRNLIKTAKGPLWLTIPVMHNDVSQSIRDMRVANHLWAEKHWKSIYHAYYQSPHFESMRSVIEPLYQQCARIDILSDINSTFITSIAQLLGIKTTIMPTPTFEKSGDKNKDLITLCKMQGATTYVSGPKAKDYIDEAMFNAEGITIEWMDYTRYPEYSQLYPPFTHQVSILDVLFNTGHDALSYIRKT